MKEHVLKTDPKTFDAMRRNLKNFEVRFNDRNFKVGDKLVLQRTKYSGEQMKAGKPLVFTGQEMSRIITYILKGPAYGLAAGWVIMSVE